MDPYSPHPPIDNIFFLFVSFIRAYITSLQPLNFLLNVPEDQTVQAFHQHSHNARFVLLQIYGLFQPLLQHHPIHRQMLQDSYMFAINCIHTKFGTHPHYAQPPTVTPDTTTQFPRPIPPPTPLSNFPLPPLLHRRRK
jgi:hypothetical protein